MHSLADACCRQYPATTSHAAAICDDCQQPGSEWSSGVEVGEPSPGVEPGFLERILGSQTIFQECSGYSPCHLRVRLDQFSEGRMVTTLSLANRRFLHHYLPFPNSAQPAGAGRPITCYLSVCKMPQNVPMNVCGAFLTSLSAVDLV